MKRTIYKGFIFVFYLVYFFFSSLFLAGSRNTYQSISYGYLNSMLGIFDYLRFSYYILLFINVILILIMSTKLIFNKNIKLLSIVFCVFHFSIGILYCIAYKYLFELVLGIMPVVVYIFLYKMYNRSNYT
jgi:hypothetical protein